MIGAPASRQRHGKPPADKEIRPPSLRTPEREVLALITLTKRTVAPDTAYRTLLGHTTTCVACRAGVSCSTAGRLGRAWREARRG
jgi:hypothetical protein